MEGTIVKATGGFFHVCSPGGAEYLCKARGKLKQNRETLLVGDGVEFHPTGAETGRGKPAEGIIEARMPRRNCLYRPQVANIDLLVLVLALKNPPPDWQLADRMLVLAEHQQMQSLVCLNKTDLVGADELSALPAAMELFPYRYILTSARRKRGVGELRKILAGKRAVFAGPSGAGKSSLLNAVQPGLFLRTETVSDKSKRGRHTTRMAELLQLKGGGAVVDTPGFTRLDFSGIAPEQLGRLFPEMEAYAAQCSFRNCSHSSEPACAVRKAVDLGRMSRLRYEHYLFFYHELVQGRDDQRCR